ncbi:hypothetical protein FI667_g4287, partial [Globisporangium splendens]
MPATSAHDTQSVESVLPQVISEDAQGFKYVAYARMVPVVVEAFKEVHQEVRTCQDEMASIRSELHEMRQLLLSQQQQIDKLLRDQERSESLDKEEKKSVRTASRLNRVDAVVGNANTIWHLSLWDICPAILQPVLVVCSMRVHAPSKSHRHAVANGYRSIVRAAATWIFRESARTATRFSCM